MTVTHDTMEWWQNASTSTNSPYNGTTTNYPYSETSTNTFEHYTLKDKSNVIDTKRIFESGSQRDDDTNKPLPSHLDAYVRMRYGYLLRMGANHYEKGNWRLGQPKETALESLHRHLAKFEINLYNGVEQDEDHLSAIIFNVMLIMKNEEKEGILVDKYYKKV